MSYLKKVALQPVVAASVFLMPLSIGTVNASEIASNAIAPSNGNVSNTIQKFEKDTLVEPLIVEPDKVSQNVTSVSALSDVKPADWAFTSLQSLVERYGCIAGYPDRTFRGKQSLSRSEFAAGLNACLDKINEVISAGLADKVGKDDLEAIKKLQEEFAAELATLRGRVDALDAKTAKLEAQQFSTTTKLNATVIFAIADAFGGDGTGTPAASRTVDKSNVNFSYRARLNFDTSFTGKDLLRARLQSGNNPNLGASGVTNTNMARLAFAQLTTGNSFEIDKLYYKFPVGNSATAYVGANKLDPDDIADPLTPFESSDRGALSRFGRYDPLIFRGPSGAGAGFSYKVSPQFTVAASYLANSDGVANANGANGLFNGGYIASLQLVYAPIPDLQLGAAYARSYEPGGTVNLAGSTGSAFGNDPFGSSRNTSADRYGAQVNWRASKAININGWVSFANARQESSTLSNNASLFNWGVGLAFPDLFAEGNRGGIIFGQPPKVTSNSVSTRIDPDTSYLLELQYSFRVSKNISITPGVFAVFNPNQNSGNPTVYVATIRTLFSF